MSTQSEQVNELAASLALAQGEIKAAEKDRVNYFKRTYSTLSSVWDACRPALSKHGLSVVQALQVADGGALVLESTLLHKSGQWMRSRYPVIADKANDAQRLGSAITYARRYALSSLVGVVADEDDDGEAAVGRGDEPTETPAAKQTKPGQQAAKGNGKSTNGAYSKDDFGAYTKDIKDAVEAANLQALNDIAAEIKKEPDALRKALGEIWLTAKKSVEKAIENNDRADEADKSSGAEV